MSPLPVVAYREPPGIDSRWFSLRAGQADLGPKAEKVASGCSVRHILAQRVKQLAAMGMCLMNGYEVFKDQTHSPHKQGTGERLSVAFHLMH